MPIYEYRCSSCGFQKDHLQKLSDARLTVCPQCSEPRYEKMLTAAGFLLKGSGWYATDFKGGSAPAAAKTDGEAKDGNADKPGTAGTDKPKTETAVASASASTATSTPASTPASTGAASS